MPAFAGMTVCGRETPIGFAVRDDRDAAYLIACGLIGLPVPPVMISGGPQKKNS